MELRSLEVDGLKKVTCQNTWSTVICEYTTKHMNVRRLMVSKNSLESDDVTRSTVAHTKLQVKLPPTRISCYG